MPLQKPFGASIAMKTVFCLKIHLHLSSCRKRSRACNEIEGFGHRSNILQGIVGPSSGVPFYLLSDPENLRNVYYVGSRAILEKPQFSHVDRRVAMKITVLRLCVTLNGL